MTDYKKVAADIGSWFEGGIFDDEQTLSQYSRDWSVVEIRPALVVRPKNREDIKRLVKYVAENKATYPELSLTVRSAGTGMSGGSLNESIIVDIADLNEVGDVRHDHIIAEPGAKFLKFEAKAAAANTFLPPYTSSRDICALGGMLANNCAGEKTLSYGKMADFTRKLKVILKDGNEYEIKPLTKPELEAKMEQKDVEGKFYSDLYHLIHGNRDLINRSRPKVSKNSSGYALWDVWDGHTFDLTRLFVGSQGTLGIMTEAEIGVVPIKPISKLYVIKFSTLSRLGEVVNAVLPYKPETLEAFDSHTFETALKFEDDLLDLMNVKGRFKRRGIYKKERREMKRGEVPALTLMIEMTGESDLEVGKKIDAVKDALVEFGPDIMSAEEASGNAAERFWMMRRKSYGVLTKNADIGFAAAFIEDTCVQPEDLPEFLPEMEKLFSESGLIYTIAGHAGNGNFHIIPLMDTTKEHDFKLISELSHEVYKLVRKYNGSITAEHSDGVSRTPYMHYMFSAEILELFARVKKIFDPENIFNPGKKISVSEEYFKEHTVREGSTESLAF